MHDKPIFKMLAAAWLAIGALSSAQAACIRTGASQTEDNRTALIPFGRVNLASPSFQPVGSLLGSVLVPPTNYTYNNANATTVLWHCLLSDMPNVYFLVATNGDDRVGGFYKIEDPGVPDEVYATWFTNVGLRQTMDGVTLSRYWKRVPVTNYLEENGRAYIRLADVPPLQAELYRIDTIPPYSGSASWYCNGVTVGSIPGMGSPTASGTPYNCIQPNSYIQLVGPGLTHDAIGEDSAYNFRFWGVDNGFGYGMRVANTLSDNASCMAKFVTPHVTFPTALLAQLRSGGAVSANFNVQIECSDVAVSGTGSGQNAIGFQVSPGAFNAAQSLGLVNANGGVLALVSDNYMSDPALAKGVGVFLQRQGGSQDMNFVGQLGNIGVGGALAGWYPALEGATPAGSSQSGYTTYDLEYQATLKQLPGAEATAGSFYATATVLVKVQ